MAWPPPTLPIDFINGDPLLDAHPDSHNETNAAIRNDIVPKINTMQGQIDSNTSGWPAGDSAIQADLNNTKSHYTISGADSIVRVDAGGTLSLESDLPPQHYTDGGGFVGYSGAMDIGRFSANGNTTGSGQTTVGSFTLTPLRPLTKIMLFAQVRMIVDAGYVSLKWAYNSGSNLIGREAVYGLGYNGTATHFAPYEASSTAPITFYCYAFKQNSSPDVTVSQSQFMFWMMD